jgi:hypothetical protein
MNLHNAIWIKFKIWNWKNWTNFYFFFFFGLNMVTILIEMSIEFKLIQFEFNQIMKIEVWKSMFLFVFSSSCKWVSERTEIIK